MLVSLIQITNFILETLVFIYITTVTFVYLFRTAESVSVSLSVLSGMTVLGK